MRRPALLLLVVLLVAGGWIGVRGVTAQRHLVLARDALLDAQDALGVSDPASARTAVERAAVETSAARRLTSDPVWALGAAVPYLGRTLATAGGVAAAADDLATQVLPALLEAAEALDPRHLRRSDGRVEVAVIRAAAPSLRANADRTEAVRRDVTALPRAGTLPQVHRASAQLLRQVTNLAIAARRAAQGAELAPVVLGDRRARRWFVLIQQPGESRGTGGLPGAYAVVEARGGYLTVAEQGPIGDMPPQGPQQIAGLPADYVQRYQPLGAFSYWVNVNLSPDLPTVAEVLTQSWELAGKPPLDGVITLDPRSLASLLAGSGPVDVGAGQSIAAADVPRFLAFEQYIGLPAVGDNQSRRKERLQVIARGAVRGLVAGQGDTLALVKGLVEAVSSGHLHIASSDPAVAPLLAEAGIDGALPRGAAPVAYAVVNNFAGGKLESWLSRRLRYTAEECRGELRRSRIELTLRSDPPEDVPPYVSINIGAQGARPLTSKLRATVYATRGAALTHAELDGELLVAGAVEQGRPALTLGNEAGLPLWDLTLDLVPGEERVLRLDLVEPTNPGAPRVPEQPLVLDQVTEVRVPACR